MSDNKKPEMLSFKPRIKFAFKGPFIRVVSKKLVIRNPSETQSVAFKLTTNTPCLILVRPKTGVLGPNQRLKVEVFMRPIFPEADQKGHMILVQGAVVSEDVTNLRRFWKMQISENIWHAMIKCKIIPCKSSNEPLVQAGGDAPMLPDTTLNPDIEYDVMLATLLKMQEDERLFCNRQNMSRRLFYVVLFLLTIVAAIVCAYYCNQYL